MEAPVKKPDVLRLVFRGSIPFEEPIQAEQWYNMLKEMVKTQSENSTLDGQVMKLLEPCCGDKTRQNLIQRVVMNPPM